MGGWLLAGDLFHLFRLLRLFLSCIFVRECRSFCLQVAVSNLLP